MKRERNGELYEDATHAWLRKSAGGTTLNENTKNVTELKEQILKNMRNPGDDTHGPTSGPSTHSLGPC